jgi:putative membrane protein
MVEADVRGQDMTTSSTTARGGRWPIGLLLGVAAVLSWSWVGATDRMTWWLESFPALFAIPLLAATYSRFRFTRLVYALIAIHACILFVGAHYTYAHVPLFDWVRDRWHLQRNDYDKVGHLAQGFVPAMVAREILIRRRVVRGYWWRVFLVMCVCMAISACYELVEWAVALAEGSDADAFLGTQGDPFDTQSDMFCALIGAAAGQLLLGRVHDRELRRIGEGIAVDAPGDDE